MRKNITIFYIFTALSSADFTRSLFVVYLVLRGQTYTDVGVLQATLFLASFALDIPLGMLADRVGRKHCLVFGTACLAGSVGAFPWAQNLPEFTMVFAGMGVGSAALSGAGEALLFDALRNGGELWTTQYPKVLSINRGIGTGTLAIALAAAGPIYHHAPNLIFYITAAFFALACATAPLLTERKRGMMTSIGNGNLPHELRTFLVSRAGLRLMVFIIGMAVFEAFCTPFFIFAQALFRSVGFSDLGISTLVSLGFASSVLANFIAGRLSFSSPLRLVSYASLILLATVACLMFTRSAWAIAAIFLVVQFIPTVVFVHTDAIIHAASDTDIRASAISIQSFVRSFAIAASYMTLGFLSDHLHPAFALVVIAAALLPCSVIGVTAYALLTRRHGAREPAPQIA